MWGMFSANTISSAAKKATCCLILNDRWPNKRLLCCFRLTTSHKKKNTHQRERKSELSSRHLALSANPTVHRMDQGGLYHHWSAVQPMGHHGSKPKVKGRTLGTAVRSAGRCKALLPTYIIENPPTVNAQILLPLSLFSVSFSLSTCNEDSSKKDKTTENTTFHQSHYLSFTHSYYQVCGPHLCIFAQMSLKLGSGLLYSCLLFCPPASIKCLNLHPKTQHCPQQAAWRCLSNHVHIHFWHASPSGSCVISTMRNAYKTRG